MSRDSLFTWYADFFTELPNAFWRAAVSPEHTLAEVDFIIRATGLRPGARVLDVSCGSGRHAAICMGNAFGYLDHHATQQFLADLARLLTPGGALVLDYGFVAESLLPHLTMEEPPMTIGGIETSQINEYDTANSRLLTTFTFRRGAQEHHGTSVQHVYTAAEVARLVTAAGFTRVDQYGDTDGTPFQLGSNRLLLVAHIP